MFVAILLIVAGTLSPSNGVDDRNFKTPLELITIMFVIVSFGLTVYLVWNRIEKFKEFPKPNYKSDVEKVLTSN
ncbi:MAG: hypothetical protein H7141_14735 [Burkholderiales bacterium]|nr:hypothetical protein [Bacteroidia bacterium]